MANIDVRGIDFVSLAARGLPATAWDEYQELELQSYRSEFPHRTEEEVKKFIEIDGFPDFKARRLDPNVNVGERHNANQEYFNPRLVIARRSGEMIAAAYSVSNVSGASEEIRRRKRLIPIKNYVAFQSVVEHPDHTDRGLFEITIALSLGLRGLRSFRRSTIYPLMEEPAETHKKINILGFRRTTDKPAIKHYFGESEGILPAEQHRYEAKAGLVVASLVKMPDGLEEFLRAKDHLKRGTKGLLKTA